MVDYDLIVCGAGPAGAIAAVTAARAGLNVALLEKYPLPRHKTCGGGVPVSMRSFLYELAPEAFVESDVRYLRHTWNYQDSYLAAINPTPSEVDRQQSIWMVQRPIFDHALVQQAVKAGAHLLDGVSVDGVEPEKGSIRVRARRTRSKIQAGGQAEFVATASYVIGADGANSVIAKTTNLQQRRAIALGIEVEFPHQWGKGHPELRPDVAHLEYGAVPCGYAWIFPKADHLNVGAGLFRPGRRDVRGDRQVRQLLQQTILDYLNSLQLPCDADQLKFHAHPLPLWCGKEPRNTADGRILLAGDAAGLINPFFGDGILYAVKSGAIAANSIVAGEAQRYSDRLHAEFAASLDAANRLAGMFYRFPRLCYRYGVKRPGATSLGVRLLSGDLRFDQVFTRVLRRFGSAFLADLW